MIRDQWVRPGPTPRQQRTDLVIGLVAAAFAVLNVFLARSVGMYATSSSPALAEQLCWAVAVTLPLCWRRRQPDVVAIIIAVTFIAGQIRGAQEQQLASGAIVAAVYTLGAWGRDRRRSRTLRISVIAAMFLWLVIAWFLSHDLMPAEGPPGASGELPPLPASLINGVIVNAAVFGIPYLMGNAAWQSALRQHQLEVQTEQLVMAQRLAGERAVIDERLRIARELHDVVAHHVSVMGIQASACRRVLDKDAERARTALTAVETSARTAVDELRRMLGALRSPDSKQTSTAPASAAGVEHIEDLADRVRTAGLTTHYAVYGNPVAVPDSISQTAYRIAQEAVTNVLKHARASTVDIRVRYLAEELELDVADDGLAEQQRAGTRADTGTGTGTGMGMGMGMGILGMRERVAVHDGVLEIGPRSGGGFRVRARLPLARPSEGPAAAKRENARRSAANPMVTAAPR
ncbi:sensor histidine kinase [Actinoplanes sp. TFC3]|uniref:sensor histidine kinase n=1 Tax=Actinoplanes sp. TFC3 TaxID=1710355 RepID=UPI0008376CA8|nr:sensor histidine kinase [Actinoplanes sp. TFC3]